jgi:hypothetical protein
VTVTTTYDRATYDVSTYDTIDVGEPTVELLLNSVWTDITAYVRVDSGITIRRGRQDWQSQPQPATCRMVLDNTDGRFAPRNASGAYYPYLVRNVQLRVSVRLDDGTTSVRFWGQVPSFPLSIDATGQQSLVPIEAAGPRRRLTVGAIPLDSPYTLFAKNLTGVLGYWPMEDGDTATAFASGLAGGINALQSGATFSSDDTFVCSKPLPVFAAGASFRATFPSSTPSVTGQQVRFLLRANGTTAGSWAVQIDTNGSHYFWVTLAPSSNAAQILMFNYTTAALEYTGTGTTLTGSLVSGMRCQFDAVQSGGNIVCHFAHIIPGDTNAYTQAETIPAATLGSITGARLFWVNQLPDGTAVPNTPDAMTFGQLTFENQVTSIYDVGAALTAYAGETAYDRWNRLCTALTIPAALYGNTSAALGPQGELTPLEILDEAAFADGGLSTEYIPGFGLAYRPRGDMYVTTALIPLVFGLSKVNSVSPVDDDQNLVNDQTVARPGGSSARAVATSGLTPAAVGTYADSAEINVWVDDMLADQAGWRVNIGSVDAPRWVIGFDALQNTSANRVLLVAMREGDCVGLTSLPTAYGGNGTGDVMQVLGWSETITQTSWDFELNAGPGVPWNQIFILDNATRGILDTDRLGL